MQKPIAKMQAGPADPQSSSDQLPVAICGKTRRTGVPWSLTFATSFALASGIAIPPPTGRLSGSEAALMPASLAADAAVCPVLARSVHGVQWSTTLRLAGVPPEAGVYFSLTNDSPYWLTPSKSPFPVRT